MAVWRKAWGRTPAWHQAGVALASRADAPSPMQWHARALADVERVHTAESRVATALGSGEAAVVAAADELNVATRDAMGWLAAHPVADPARAARVARMLKAYAAVERAAQELAAYPGLEAHEARKRLRDLVAVVDHQADHLDPWR